MVKRTEIALLFKYNDNWIGGSYYIINIIKALNLLSDDEKPRLILYYDSEAAIRQIADIHYPDIEFRQFTIDKSLFKRAVNRISKAIFKQLFFKQKIDSTLIKNFYPVPEWMDTANIQNYYYWIPDFQERYLPGFFSKTEIAQRIAYQKLMVKNNYPLIFSSNNARADFDKFYPENSNKKKVLQFVSIINDDYKTLKIEELRKKFDIEGDYFISPNQFWQHKNHSVIVKAVEILKERGTKVLIVFTGKEHDHRNPNYVNDLKNEIYRNNMQGCFRFLGFIDRGEQLQLMKNSISVIQPSLFEGWSTVVEDTKVLNHKIILSDLPLHREQINKNYLFFNPLDAVDLADKIEYAMSNNFFSSDFPNDEYRYVFAKKIIDLFEIE